MNEIDPWTKDGAYSLLVDKLIDAVHEAGGDVTIVSAQLPYDASRYDKADAVVLTWFAKGMTSDPRAAEGAPTSYGVNLPAALMQILNKDGIFLGTDISPEAISLAQENAARCGLAGRVKFAVADGLDDFDEGGMFDVIVSNPPYVTRAEMEKLDPRVRDHEPRLALDGGETGLDFYERYLADAMNLLRSGGKIFFEIGENQGEAVARMMSDYGFADVKVEKDFAGHDRYASATQQG
jgi:tRNA1(Val) A37 N6-methylase TrmN6